MISDRSCPKCGISESPVVLKKCDYMRQLMLNDGFKPAIKAIRIITAYVFVLVGLLAEVILLLELAVAIEIPFPYMNFSIYNWIFDPSFLVSTAALCGTICYVLIPDKKTVSIYELGRYI